MFYMAIMTSWIINDSLPGFTLSHEAVSDFRIEIFIAFLTQALYGVSHYGMLAIIDVPVLIFTFFSQQQSFNAIY